MKLAKLLTTLATLTAVTSAGPAGYGVCQAGCSAVVVACYSGAGFTFGTVTAGAAVPAAIVACNSAFGTCQAACAAVLIAPTPEHSLQIKKVDGPSRTTPHSSLDVTYDHDDDDADTKEGLTYGNLAES
ncbi:MAG: hypothetical protein L6R36_002995 [Xanthoria steineri]|nr:MAG: hypothetical protein L6R36_002995 [Xanthoria steineri]